MHMKHLEFGPGTRSQINLNKFEISKIQLIGSDHSELNQTPVIKYKGTK